MLQQLMVSNLGAIAAAELELGDGLTVITGETGAGKTMLMEALGLVLGDRADSGLVRTGADRSVVQARFGPVSEDVAEVVADLGGELDDDGSLVIVRTVGADGRSRAVVGGASVPVGALGRLAKRLVRVHGQQDRGLADASGQRRALDRFAGTAELLAEYRGAREELLAARAELASFSGSAADLAAEAEKLRRDLDVIEAVSPEPGEDVALRTDIARLDNVELLQSSLARARAALTGDPDDSAGLDAALLLGRAIDQLRLAGEHDPNLADWADRLSETAAIVGEAGADLARSLDDLDADPARLAALHDRLAAVSALTRRFGGDAAAVVAHAAEAGRRLAQIDGGDDRIAELTESEGRIAVAAGEAAAALSDARQAAGERLAAAVGAELAELAMPQASVEVRVEQTEATDPREAVPVAGRPLRFGVDGVDDVSLLLSAHPGAPLRPIGKAASGGELSRAMLATEVVFADADPTGTYVFDEIDAGVGGRAAVEVGRRLARLGACGQVLVVTHLPQVAAFGHRHLVVTKDVDGETGSTGVSELDDAARAGELARMLAGLPESELGRAHAGELLDLAAHDRAALRR